MNNKQLLFTLLFLAGTIAFQNVHAQTDSCITYLKTANSNYEQRDFDSAIKLLQAALSECNLDRADKIQAHKLLALSYLSIDNLEAADKEAEAIVKINPNYTPDRFKDDPKYSALFEKFTPVPVFRIGFSAGINQSVIDVVNSYSIVHDDAATGLSHYNHKTGFQLGLQAEYRVYKDLWVEAAGLYRQSQYEHILDSVEGTTINYSEKLSYFDVPVSLKYYFTLKNISPYIEAGGAFSFLTNAQSTTTRDDNKDIVNRTDYRNIFQPGWFLGAGLSYKINSFNLFASYRYFFYSDYVNKDGTRYADEVNVFKYYYIDDDFKMNNWQVNVGVNYTVSYKNKKVK